MNPSDLKADSENILEVLEQEVAAIGAGDARSYRAILDDEAVFMPPNGPARRGEDLRRWLEEFLQEIAVRWIEHDHLETVIEGGLAYHTFACSWQATRKKGGESRALHFKGLHILRRQPGGAWKITREIWNTSPEES